MSVWGMHRRSVWRSGNTSPLIMDPERKPDMQIKNYDYYNYNNIIMLIIIMLIWILSYWPDIVCLSIRLVYLLYPYLGRRGLPDIVPLQNLILLFLSIHTRSGSPLPFIIVCKQRFILHLAITFLTFVNSVMFLCFRMIFFSYDPSCSPRYCI